jgi:glycosyl transferase family 25
LETTDTHALICEDDVLPSKDLSEVLQSALCHSGAWNILRLTGLSCGIPLPARKLCGDYRLCVSLGRLKGAGAYAIDRAAARAFSAHLLPMWLPYDHAFDREWFFGLRAAYVLPFPCSQTEHSFSSSIQKAGSQRLPALNRWLTTYPYQAFNESMRWVFRGANYLRARRSMPETARAPAANDG